METDCDKSLFTLAVRVYIEDTDAGGIVYHGNYLKFMERARTEMLRELGFGKAAVSEDGALIVVTDVKIRYHRPALLDECLRVETKLVSLKRVTAVMEQIVYRDDQILTSGKVEIAAVNQKTMRPVAFPSCMSDAMKDVLADLS